MDWFNFKEFIGCILLEQAFGTPWGVLAAIEARLGTNSYRRLVVKRGVTEDSYRTWAGIGMTVLSIISIYAAGDYFFNIF